MDIRKHFTREKHRGFTACEILTLIYIVITTIMTAIWWNRIPDPIQLIHTRIWILIFMVALYVISRIIPCRATWMLRSMALLILLAYWYPETYSFAQCHPYLDHFFAQADMTLFGCQPSIEFSKIVTSVFWCEAFNMGYYSYYFMMIGVMLYCLYARFEKSERYMFIFLGVFFLYYLIFELIPVAGPYYYFKAIGIETARQGFYPDLGNYFASHNELIHAEVRGVFSQLVHDIQIAGENPVGAFPSSHVGMSTVTMIVAWKTHNKWLFWCLTPFYLLLCIATVYIMAHYLVDSIAGFITACLFYWLMDMLYTFIHRKQEVQPIENL